MTARKAKLPSAEEFLNAFDVVRRVAEDEPDPRRAKLFILAAEQLCFATQIRANGGSLDKAAQYHRWAIANVQKAMFLRGGAS